jgi:hypothetical protein
VLLVYRPDGSLRRAVPLPVTEAHGLTVVDHNGVECLWIADNGVKPRRQADGGYRPTSSHTDGQAILVTLDAAVLQRLPKPPLEVYGNGPYCPTSIAVDEVARGGSGDVWVADGYGQSLVHRYDRHGRYMRSFGFDDDPGGRLNCPHAIVIDRRGTDPQLYVADRRNARVQVYDLDGAFRRTLSGVDFVSPSALAIWRDNLIVAEHRGARLAVLDRNDRLVEYLGRDDAAQHRPGWPNALSLDGKAVAPELTFGRFNSPHGVAAGNDGTLYVTEWLIGGRLVRLGPIE